VAPDGHAVSVHAHVGYGHAKEHLFAATVDAASRRHNPRFASSRKYVVFVSSVNVPGIAPVSLLFCMDLLSRRAERLLYKHKHATQVYVLHAFCFLHKADFAQGRTW
jgi:hypothetical protein